jgi:hypothetical protein
MWLIVQGTYALFAWWWAARVVARAATLAGALDPQVLAAVRALVRRGRVDACDGLAERVGVSAITEVLCAHREGDEPIDRLDGVLAREAPPHRALRGLATIGTMLGLLAAIATLRGGGSGTRALESALMGFSTAIPLWTAVGLSVSRWRRASRALEKLAAARMGVGVTEGLAGEVEDCGEPSGRRGPTSDVDE